jgi:hypothetical protein
MSTYQWQELYKAALLETDWSKMEERIQAAESAIQNRKREFALNSGGTQEENQSSQMPERSECSQVRSGVMVDPEIAGERICA